MLSRLQTLDLNLFQLVNTMNWPEWFSVLLSALGQANLWIAPIALAVLILVILGGPRARVYVVTALLALLLTEFLVSEIVKPLIARPRPCHVLREVRLLGGCTRSFAMPSGHASNVVAQAVVLGLFYGRAFFISLPVAGLVGLSRVVHGKHYPGDVLAGMLLGLGVALLIVRVFRFRLEAVDRRMVGWFFPQGRISRPRLPVIGNPSVVFWCCLGVAALVRLGWAGWTDLAPGEAALWDQARDIGGWGWLSASPAEALAAAGTSLLGDSEWGVRVFSVTASILTSIILYAWARRTFPWSGWAGPIAGLGLLAAPVFGIGGASLTETTLSFLFWSGALASAERSIAREDEAPWGWWVWGLCVALAVRIHPFSVLLVPLAVFRVVLTRAGRRQLTRAAPYLGLALAVAVTFTPWALGAETGSRPLAGGRPEEIGAFLLWPVVQLSAPLVLFILWGGAWVFCTGLRERNKEYLHLAWFFPVLIGCFLVWIKAGDVRAEWAAPAWLPAWMTAVGATTEILRRRNDQSLHLLKILALVLLTGLFQTAILLNGGLLRKLEFKWIPESTFANQVTGWSQLGERVTRSLKEMGEETVLLAADSGTAAAVSFYTRPDGVPLQKPNVRRIRTQGRPLAYPNGPEGWRALLVMVGEWGEPPASVRRAFNTWSRESFFRVKRGKFKVIRSVTLFRLLGYTGLPK
ncbi:MAG: phosphatase PAP2 family protein [Nitrospinota bacterium]|nr:phosphatase PAP2 family protein [Nitrospinota bacterium]